MSASGGCRLLCCLCWLAAVPSKTERPRRYLAERRYEPPTYIASLHHRLWVGVAAADLRHGVLLHRPQAGCYSAAQSVACLDVALWLTPTLGGILFALWPVSWIRYLGLIVVRIVPVLYSRFRQQPVSLLLGLTLGGAIAESPFGWSFDQVGLLPLILYLLALRRQFRRWWIDLSLLAIYCVPLMMRIAQMDEFYYFRIPWLVLAMSFGVARSGKPSLHLSEFVRRYGPS